MFWYLEDLILFFCFCTWEHFCSSSSFISIKPALRFQLKWSDYSNQCTEFGSFQIAIADLSTGLLKHWKKVRVELSGEGARYDVTRGYNQVKVKTSRIRNQLPSSGHCPLSFSPSTLCPGAHGARACWSREKLSSAQQPAALHDIIIIASNHYCTKSQEIY